MLSKLSSQWDKVMAAISTPAMKCGDALCMQGADTDLLDAWRSWSPDQHWNAESRKF